MDVVAYLIPIALFLGLVGLGAFFWSMRAGQFEDLDGAAMRALRDDDGTLPGQEKPKKKQAVGSQERPNSSASNS